MFSSLICKNSKFLCHFGRQSKPFLRGISFLEKIRPSSSILSKTQYKVVYEFPYIRIIAPVLKFHKSVPAFGVAVSPLLYYLDETKVSVFITLGSAVIYFLIGIAVSKLSKNVIGKIYINTKDNVKNVMISSVDESGRRVDRIHNLEDVINSDFSTTIGKSLGFVTLSIVNSDMYYLLNVRNCKFRDVDGCKYILGENWIFHDAERKEAETKDSDNQMQVKG